ncbi:MAG: cytochrome c oxidase subunit I [Anaerolineales bacterium]
MKSLLQPGGIRGLLWMALGLLAGPQALALLQFLATKKYNPFDVGSWVLGSVVALLAFFVGAGGRQVFHLGLMRGLGWQLLGTLAGGFFVEALRALLPEMEPFGKFGFSEPGWVFGALVGTISFLAGVGALSDWFSWAKGESTPEHHHDPQGWQKYFGVSLDHKVIGVQYTFTSLFLLSYGGLFALLFRTELAKSGMQFLDLNVYNTLMGLHGMVMIVSILLGIAGVINYLVPLLLGAQDMAFPRINAFSFWIAVPAAVLLLSSMALGGFDTGWTGYPPLALRAPVGVQMFYTGVWVAGWSSILGALNLIVTVLRLRAKGMSAFRMPIFVWAAVATSIISLTATQMIGLAFQLVIFERIAGMPFFDPGLGGNPILFQHLFWFYSHPVVYVFILPGLGVISELLPVFVRKPLFGYRWIAMSSLAIALVGFLVWAHHMFASGMNEYLRVPFMYSTLLVAVPTGVKFFSWVATIWRGKIPRDMPTPLLFVFAGIFVFLLGGLSGPPNATVSTDLHLTDTYFIVGHFHDTMFGGYVFPFFAALYYWFPKAFGKRLDEKLGKIHFWLMAPSFIFLTLGMMRIGLLGMRRRIADYDPALGFDIWHLLLTIAAFLIATSVLIFFINVYKTLKNGAPATGNVWNSRSPEWQVPSPLPSYNYERPFEVVGEPYDYGLADSPYVKM